MFVVKDALQDTAEMFCRETRILRETIDVPIVAGTDTYTLYPNMSDAAVAETLFARIGDDHIEPITPDIASRLIAGTGDPEFIEQTASNQIRLIPAPKADATLRVTVILTPSLTSASLPSALDQWREGIRHGAIARLVSIPDQPWSNAQTASTSSGLYAAAVRDAQTKSTLGNRKVTLRVQSSS